VENVTLVRGAAIKFPAYLLIVRSISRQEILLQAGSFMNGITLMNELQHPLDQLLNGDAFGLCFEVPHYAVPKNGHRYGFHIFDIGGVFAH
jgi:hypothetical protein